MPVNFTVCYTVSPEKWESLSAIVRTPKVQKRRAYKPWNLRKPDAILFIAFAEANQIKLWLTEETRPGKPRDRRGSSKLRIKPPKRRALLFKNTASPSPRFPQWVNLMDRRAFPNR